MTEAKAHSHVKIFKQLSGEPLSTERAAKLVEEMLQLSWIKRFQVFADQAVVLVELNTSKYLYVSPSIKNVTGYSAEEVTDFYFMATLISEQEMEIIIKISNLFADKITESKLTPDEVSRLHSVRNAWVKKRDGSLINLLQHGFTATVSEQGNPLAQILILTDITAFNDKPDHFYSLTLHEEDGEDKLLLSGKVEGADEQISVREREVLALISKGNSSQQIAQQLYISVETVKTHRKNILEKTNTSNSTDLIRHAYAHGWL
jgi:DNA-binding CsgD family transcriptional regulator